MSLLATFSLAWAAVHAFVAASFAFLAVRARRSAVYLAFAIVSLALATYSVTAAVIADAASESVSAFGHEIQWIAGVITLVAFSQLLYDLLGQTESKWMHATFVWSVIALVAGFSGVTVDAAVTSVRHRPPAWLGHHAPAAALTPVTLLLSAAGIALLARVILVTIRHARVVPGAPVLLTAGTLGFIGFAHDTIVEVLQLPTMTLFEHMVVVGSVLMSYVLLRRFALAADALEERTRDLQRAYAELRHVEAELVRKEQLAAVGELSAVIAHEVRTPLTVLKNSVAGLRHEAIGDSDRTTLLGVLDEESDRLNRLVRDLLAYARPINPQLAEVPLEPLLERAADAAMREIERSDSHRVQISFDLDGAPPNVRADRDLLERAIANLVENGIQAMPDGGTVTIRARESIGDSGPTVRIAVQDQGEGMDTLVRSRARIPFFTTRPTGTGLGLAIVERIIRAHGGKLDLTSASEHGTAATITLPHA